MGKLHTTITLKQYMNIHITPTERKELNFINKDDADNELEYRYGHYE